MSNLSDIGFPVKSEQDVNQVIMDILPHLTQIPCPPRGYYYRFADESGAEIYLQTNPAQEIIGFNPAYDGKSLFRVGLIEKIERDTSDLDGAFQAWASPHDEKSPADTGLFPFVFDLPDFRTKDRIDLPKTTDIQLSAFASSDFEIFVSEAEYENAQSDKPHFAAKSFVPSGLFNVQQNSADQNDEIEQAIPPQAHAIFAGEIKDFARRTNKFSGAEFCWFQIETLGGEIDVLADPNLIKIEPALGGIVRGSFWLSGKIID